MHHHNRLLIDPMSEFCATLVECICTHDNLVLVSTGVDMVDRCVDK